MRTHVHASLIALALMGAPLAAQDAAPSPAPGDFRLPPSPSPTPSDVQGPVDPDAPILTRPRVPTPTPSAAPRPVPTATAAPAPAAAPPVARPTGVPPPRNSSLPPRFTPPAEPTAEESAAVVGSAAPFPGDQATPGLNLPPVAVDAAPAGQAPAPAQPDEGFPLFAIAGILALVGLGAGAFFWRRRRAPRRASDTAPVIAPPIVPAQPSRDAPNGLAPSAAAPPSPAGAIANPLLIEARAMRLQRSMMFATLGYEIAITNRGGVPLENVQLGGDLVTAHARVPTAQQLADPALPLAPMKAIARLDPGQSERLTGELRLPVGEIRPIPHGKAVVYVPLLRVRAEADGLAPVARTFVVGMTPGGPGQRLQPFRLDEMPQTYNAVGQKALD